MDVVPRLSSLVPRDSIRLQPGSGGLRRDEQCIDDRFYAIAGLARTASAKNKLNRHRRFLDLTAIILYQEIEVKSEN